MNRYETACNQAAAWLELLQEIAGSALGVPELPAIAELTESYHRELQALGPVPDSPASQEAHKEAWQKLCRQINKQVRLLDEALGHMFLRHASEIMDRHREAMVRMEAELAQDLAASEDPDDLDSAGVDRAGLEATVLRELWPIELLDVFDMRERVRRARLGRYPAGFSELEQLLSEMSEAVPHMVDTSVLLAELHRKRTWEEGYYPVLDVQGALLEAIDQAFRQGVSKLATSAPKKASSLLASGLKRLPSYRARTEAIVDIALGDQPATREGSGG